MRIATWNVNSVNARIEGVVRWFETEQPDVAALQEIKCIDEKFPSEAFERLGYNVAVHGQKTYNGVALLSKFPLEDVRKGLPGSDVDDHARYIEAVVVAPSPFRVAGIYLPNGNPIGTEKFEYKLDWFARLRRHAGELLALEEPLVMVGDYNVIPEPCDCDKPESWVTDALYQPESRAAWRSLKHLGLVDAYMQADGAPGGYTFWDYQAGAWQRNHGIRIDHALLSPQAADRLKSVIIHRDVRDTEKPSDHVPVVVELDLLTDAVRLVLLLALAGVAITVLASFLSWQQDIERKLRRYLRRSLGGEPDAQVVVRGRAAAAGIRLATGHALVLWDGGTKALLYPLPALLGAELIVDGKVAARIYRGEPRRALDAIENEAKRVTLRLIFDNPRDPDFDLDLWLAADAYRRDAQGPAAAIQEGRTWLARVEALLRLPVLPPTAPEPRIAPEKPADTTPPWEDEAYEPEEPDLFDKDED